MKLYSKSQTLITGVYRTGSEYLAQIIGCNPSISVNMYGVNVLRFVYGKYDPFSKKINYSKALTDVANRIKDRYQIEINLDTILSELDSLDIVSYGKFYDILMFNIYMKKSSKHWAEKNQLLWREIPKFLEMMPNGKAVLILRDPRAVLMSFKNYTYAPKPLYLEAIFNCYDAMKHAKIFQRNFPKQVQIIKYEDLVIDPQKIAENFWKFIGINDRHDVKLKDNWVDVYGKKWEVNSSFSMKDENFNAGLAVNRWKAKINDQEIDLTEEICGELMEEFNYKLLLNSSIKSGAISKEIFKKNSSIINTYERWKELSEGIQSFPTDPLKPENWRND